MDPAQRAMAERAMANPVRAAKVKERQEMNAARTAARKAAGIFTPCEEEEKKPHPVEVGTTYRFDGDAWKCDQTRDALSPSLLGAKVQLKKKGGDQETCTIVAVDKTGLTCAGKFFGTRNAKNTDYDEFTILNLKAGGKRRKTRKASKRSKRTRRSRS